MLDYEGPLHRAVLSRTLWLVLLGPLLGLFWQLLIVRSRAARARGQAFRKELARAGLAGALGVFAAAGALAVHVVQLLAAPAGQKALYDHVLSGARLPGLEAPLDLWLDERSAVACGLACVVACASAVRLASAPPFERLWSRWAWLQLALLGALLAFLADGLVTVVAGWSLAGAAGAWLAGWRDHRASVPAAAWAVVAGSAVLVGIALLYWGLGGSWEDAQYETDPQPLIAVRTGGRAGEATLSLTGAPGALVSIDDARPSSLRSPFVRLPVAPGPHVVRVSNGAVADARSRLVLADGDDVALVPVGPTLSLHTMRDALEVRDRRGEPVFRRLLEARVAPGGIGVVAATLLAWLVATFAMGNLSVPQAALAPPGALSALASSATTSLLGPMLMLHADFLLPSAVRAGAVIAIAGAAMVLGATWRALPYDGTSRWLVFATAAPTGLACIALGLGGSSRALVAVSVVGLGVAALKLFAPRVEVPGPEAFDDPEDTAVLTIPERIGGLLATMEHGVVGAVAGAATASAHIAAWTVAMTDQHVIASPADRVADGLVRASRAATPVTGASLGRIVWVLLTLVGVAALVHALWPGG
jgi:hypothetical protein